MKATRVNGFGISSFPETRQFTMDIGKLGREKHHVKALLEIDVTESRKKLKLFRVREKLNISFTAWLIRCIALAAAQHPPMHALRKGKRWLQQFDEVDLSLAVEKEVKGVPVPIPLVIRNAGGKEAHEISGEIDAAKARVVKNEGDYVIDEKSGSRWIGLFLHLPQFIRLFIWKILLSSPSRVKKMMGTVMVTALGMFGKTPGWIIPFSIHPLCFALGAVVKKPGVAKGVVQIREYLHMTVLIDHDVVDGAPAARFIAKLTDMIEKGAGL